MDDKLGIDWSVILIKYENKTKYEYNVVSNIRMSAFDIEKRSTAETELKELA